MVGTILDLDLDFLLVRVVGGAGIRIMTFFGWWGG